MGPSGHRVLLLDRHASRERVKAGLTGSGYGVVTAAGPEEAARILGDGFEPRLVILGDGGEGEQADNLAAIRAAAPSVPVALLESADDDLAELVTGFRGVEIVSRDRVPESLDAALVRLLESSREESARSTTPRGAPAGGGRGGSSGGGAASAPAPAPAAEAEETLVVASDAMRRIRDLVEQVADTDVPVLVTGDSGVGKEVVARALHAASGRSGRPFVKVNCAALPDQLLESELFGYERGAFTGADRRKRGKFGLAHEGTIFLDEIGEIDGNIQAKLLQVLQDGCYFRLGGDREIRVDARVVASTNRHLEEAMAEGSFRKDLFFRLNVVRIEVPPLRDRREEIPVLAEHFLRRYEAEYGREIGSLPDRVIQRLQRHDWPGNVRELQNVVRRMVVLEEIDAGLAAVPTDGAVADGSPSLDIDALIGSDGELPPLKEVSRLAALEVEGELIRRALERTDWNRRKAAELLHISYKALLYKIRDCGITPP